MNKQTNGKHILAELWDCQCDMALLNDVELLTARLTDAVKIVGLTMVGKTAHTFNEAGRESSQNSGVTLCLLLAESHLAIHTWGEYRSTTLDIYVCNHSQNNEQKASDLFEICREMLLPADYNKTIINRHHTPNRRN